MDSVSLIRNPDITSLELMEYMKGPDFPTAGYIMGREGIQQAYTTGRGTITMRAKTTIEEEGNKPRIIVHELPYQVIKARLVEKIAELVHEKRIDGITDLRDESDRNGMRIVIELRRDVNPNVVLNNLYKHTAMQIELRRQHAGAGERRAEDSELARLLYYYLQHQVEVIRRRTEYDLRKAEARAIFSKDCGSRSTISTK